MKPQSARIGLLHHVGGGNLGDDATFDVVVENIKKRRPAAIITALSMNPDDTAKRHGCRSYPIRQKTWPFGYCSQPAQRTIKGTVKGFARKYPILFRVLRSVNTVFRLPRVVFRELLFLAACFGVIRSLDVLIVSGGGQLTEWGGPWGFPYTIFKWVLLARIAGVDRLVLNVGAGPLTHPLSQFFVARALWGARYVSFRDLQSQILSREIGFNGYSQVFPDSAYSLEVPASAPICPESRRRRRVGIAPMPYCDPRVYPAEKNQSIYDTFIQKLAEFAWLLDQQGYAVELFGTDIGVDPLSIEDVQATLGEKYRAAPLPYRPVGSTEELLKQMSTFDYVVTCRYHGVIFSHLVNKPALAIAHHPKVTHIMGSLGLADYCVDILDFDPVLLMNKFTLLENNAEDVRRQLALRQAEYRSQLKRQFDDIFCEKTVDPRRRDLGCSEMLSSLEVR
jgi:polysaccharide pyruvyl transferase WcaK-like protein